MQICASARDRLVVLLIAAAVKPSGIKPHLCVLHLATSICVSVFICSSGRILLIVPQPVSAFMHERIFVIHTCAHTVCRLAYVLRVCFVLFFCFVLFLLKSYFRSEFANHIK